MTPIYQRKSFNLISNHLLIICLVLVFATQPMLAKKGEKKILVITIAAGEKRKVIDLGELFLPVPK